MHIGIAALGAWLASASTASAQHTIIRQDGVEVACKVLGSANGQLRYDPGSGEKPIACGEVLAIIDERLMVHADPCAAAAALDRTSPNCASVLQKNGSVVKCEVIAGMDDYWRIRTSAGVRTVPAGEVAGVLNGGEAFLFTEDKYAKQFMSDANTLRMINDVSQCPSGYGEVRTARSQARQKPILEAAQKKAAIERAKANDGAGPVVKARMDKQADGLFQDAYKDRVETSSVPKDGGPVQTRRRMAHDYLIHLLSLGKKYTHVKVDFADFRIGELERQEDGSYKGIITVQQVFAGEIDGQRVYGDVTVKNIEIDIRQYDKLTKDGMKKFWDVFLGDISVVTTQRD